MTPFEKLTGRSASQTTTTTPPVRQYRPISTGNTVVDAAHRQMFDQVDSLRNNYGPASLFAVGTGAPVVVPATTGDGNGFSVSTALTRQGTWVITAAVALTIASDPSVQFRMALQVNNVTVTSHYCYWTSATDGTVMLHQSWQVASKRGNEVCSLVIRKTSTATGTSSVDPTSSTITATWQGT